MRVARAPPPLRLATLLAKLMSVPRLEIAKSVVCYSLMIWFCFLPQNLASSTDFVHLPEKHLPERTFSQKTLGPECTFSRMASCQNVQLMLATIIQQDEIKLFCSVSREIYVLFNRFACFWPKGYQRGSLGKSHQNGDYLKKQSEKVVFPQHSNLQPLDYRSNTSSNAVERQLFRIACFKYSPFWLLFPRLPRW